MHQDEINGEPVKPGAESALAAIRADFSDQMHENILRQIFSLGRIAGHTQTDTINLPVMALVQVPQSVNVTVGNSTRQEIVVIGGRAGAHQRGKPPRPGLARNGSYFSGCQERFVHRKQNLG